MPAVIYVKSDKEGVYVERSVKTRDKIIDTAIALFNREGVFNVSMRMIADSIGISVGNLTYHFRKKDDLISEIMMRKIKERNIYGYSTYIDLPGFNHFLKELNERHCLYSFLFDDLVSLTKQFRLVRETEIRSITELKFFYNQTLKSFVMQGLMQGEKYDCQFNNLVDAMITISSFYTQQKTIAANFPSDSQNLITMIWALLTPYLTPRGYKQFLNDVFPQFSGAG